jgi:hypothetical protein
MIAPVKQRVAKPKKERQVKILLDGKISKAMSVGDKFKKCYYENTEYRQYKRKKMREYYRNKVMTQEFLQLCNINIV